MEIQDLYESLKKLIVEGKGHYTVCIQYFDDYVDAACVGDMGIHERAESLSIYDENESILLGGN